MSFQSKVDFINYSFNPFVSVLMTAFNREKYIAQAIESVLNSTYQNFELIVVDDLSSDKTVEIARSYEAKDKRLTVYVNENNLGDYPNRNKAASYAKGKYIKYLDSDDYFYPDSLEYCVSMMETNPEAGWAIYNDDTANEGKLLSPKQSIHDHFFKKQLLITGPGGSILKRSFFIETGLYPTSYGPANDMYFNLLAATKGNLLLLTKEFLFYRLHEGQEINNKYAYLYNNYNYLKDAMQFIKPFLTKKQALWIERKYKRRFFVNILNYYSKTKSWPKTKEALGKTQFGFKDALQGIFH